MVYGTYCIVFTQVVVIHFYPRSCNSIGVLRNHVNWQIKTSNEGSRIWRWNQGFLEIFWRQYKVKKIHFKTENPFPTSGAASGAISTWPYTIRTWGSVATSLGCHSRPCICQLCSITGIFYLQLVFQVGSVQKPSFLLLNPTQSFAINRDSLLITVLWLTLYYFLDIINKVFIQFIFLYCPI